MRYLFLSITIIVLMVSACTKISTIGTSGKAYDSDSTLTQGIAAYQERNYNKAKSLLTRSSSLNLPESKQIETHKHLAFIHALQGNKTLAIQHFMRCFEIDHGFKLGKAELGHPAWTPAYEQSEKESTLKYSSPEDLFRNGKNAYSQREYDIAVTSLLAALTKPEMKNEHRIEAHKLLAFTYAIQKRPADAKAQFRKAFTIDKAFALDKAEYGNPVWTPLYDAVKSEFAK